MVAVAMSFSLSTPLLTDTHFVTIHDESGGLHLPLLVGLGIDWLVRERGLASAPAHICDIYALSTTSLS